MEIQGEVEELSITSNTLPLELANTNKQLESEKENYIEEEQGIPLCFPRISSIHRIILTAHGHFQNWIYAKDLES